MTVRLVILLIFIFGWRSSIFAQSNVKSLPYFPEPNYITNKGIEKEINLDAWVDRVTYDINTVQPGAFTSHPSEDKILIRSAFETVANEMEKHGYDEKDALKALFYAWVSLSIKGYNKTHEEVVFSEQDLVNKALSMGVVKISTLPPGASISIDGYLLGVTDNIFAVDAGNHLIEIEKKGFISIYKKIEVKKLKTTNLDEKLQRQ